MCVLPTAIPGLKWFSGYVPGRLTDPSSSMQALARASGPEELCWRQPLTSLSLSSYRKAPGDFMTV